MARIAVLCGTGMSAFASQLSSSTGDKSSTLRVDSDWGQVPVTLIDTGAGEVMVIDRHHSVSDSRTPPHRIEHRANVHAATSFESTAVISVWCVGTMDPDFPPGAVSYTHLTLPTKA